MTSSKQRTLQSRMEEDYIPWNTQGNRNIPESSTYCNALLPAQTSQRTQKHHDHSDKASRWRNVVPTTSRVSPSADRAAGTSSAGKDNQTHKISDGAGVGYPPIFMQSSQPRIYSEVIRSTKAQTTLTEDHCWDVPLTTLGNGTPLTDTGAGGYDNIGKPQAPDYLRQPEVLQKSTPSIELAGKEGIHTTAPTTTAQSIQNREGVKNNISVADGGRDGNFPHHRGGTPSTPHSTT